MLNRFNLFAFQPSIISPELRPRVHVPNMDRKTRADIRREILSKLTIRMRHLGISNG